MKDFLFFIGVICWALWFADTVYFAMKNKTAFTPQASKVIQFLAITLVTFSWYIV